jgi:hypothetical protein
MAIKITGLKEMQKRLGDLSRRAKNLEGPQNVSITELLTPAFLSKCSRFRSAAELFEASGFTVNSQEDIASIPDDKWDAFIKQNTSYSSWEEMLKAAGTAWVKRELGM